LPLRGNFEISGEVGPCGGREAHLVYGGLCLDLKRDLTNYDTISFLGRLRSGTLEPPLAPLGEWYRLRLGVQDGTWHVYINDRKICEEPLPAQADPWLLLHADQPAAAACRNLKLTGQPTVPDILALTALPDLTGWRAYYDEKLMVRTTGYYWD